MTIRSLILLAANFAYLQPTEPPVVFPSGTVLAYSGSDVLYTVPANTWFLQIKLWGGGGGSNRDVGYGGGANFVQCVIAVTPGETLIFRVARGGSGGGNGINGGTGNPLPGGTGGWPGGGKGGDASSYGGGGGGGGYSGVFRGSTPLAIAGGGGGGGDDGHAADSEGGAGYLQGATSASIGGGGGGGYAGGSAVQSWTGGNRGTSYVDPSATSVTLTSASGRTQANSGDPDNGGAGLGAQAGNTGENSTSPYLGYKGSDGKIIVRY